MADLSSEESQCSTSSSLIFWFSILTKKKSLFEVLGLERKARVPLPSPTESSEDAGNWEYKTIILETINSSTLAMFHMPSPLNFRFESISLEIRERQRP